MTRKQTSAVRPGVLRTQQRVDLENLAVRLKISVADLRALERKPIDQWEVGELKEYLAALGYRLELTAVEEGVAFTVVGKERL